MTFQSCFAAMGTRMQCVIPHIDQEYGEHLVQLIADKVLQLEGALSFYNENSALRELNDQLKHKKTAQFDDVHLAQALQLAEAGFKSTCGFYNAACGDMVKKVKRGEPAHITDNTFSLLAGDTVRVAEHGIQFDFGGLAKGIAVDEAVSLLREEGIECALLSFGDSSIFGLGQHPHGQYWPIAIPEPSTHKVLAQVHLRDNGITLSSTLANGRNHGQQQHHIVNPFTATVVTRPLTTSVESTSMAWGEMLSTASLISEVKQVAHCVPADAGVKGISIFEHQHQEAYFDFH